MKLPVKPFAVGVVQCRGTPYEVGRAQARLFAATPKGRAFLRRKTRFPWWFKLDTEARMFAKFAPVLWEELAGLADELGITMEQAAYWFGNDGMRPPIGACSAVMTPVSTAATTISGRATTAPSSRCCKPVAAMPASAQPIS